MRSLQSVSVLATTSLLLSLAGCAADSMKSSETPSTPTEQAETGKKQPPSGEVQERAVPRIAPGVLAPPTAGIAVPPSPIPGEFALRTLKGFYVTAIDGGGRTADPILVTASMTAGPWEKFKVAVTYPNTPNDKSIQTARGNYVTAVSGGGLTTGVFHTDAAQARDWERFRILDLTDGNFAPSYYALYTIKGFYVTAVGAGGKYADAFHTDAKQIQDWEKFRIVKCGDIGSGFQYGVLAANGSFLESGVASGRGQGDMWLDSYAGPQTRFRLIRQGDGTYSLQTSNGINYVTALGGGGQVQRFEQCDPGFPGACLSGVSTIFHTDATQVQAWEKFRFIDQGNCTYAIQTVSGYYMGIFKDPSGHYAMLLTTDRSTISENEKFQLVVYGLASPAILH